MAKKKKTNQPQNAKSRQNFRSSDRSSRNSNANGSRRNSDSKSKSKRFEVNIPDDEVNAEDLANNKEFIRKGRNHSKPNDASWYKHLPELMSTANASFSWPLGTIVPLNNAQLSTTAKQFEPAIPSVPGIMRIDYAPCIGQAIGYQGDPINTAITKYYVYVRHAVSTYANYDAADMGMYLLALDSVYQFYAYCARIYGVAMNFKVFNRYFDKGILQSMDVDAEDIVTHLSEFRSSLNYIAYSLAQFCAPVDMDYFTRHIWMASNLFADGESIKSQLYFFNLAGWYQWEEGPAEGGPGYLRYIPTPATSSSTWKVSSLIGQLRNLMARITNSQDFIAISGDTLRALGNDKMFTILPIAENYMIEPIYSQEVLSQIENLTIMGDPAHESDSSQNFNANIRMQTALNAGSSLRQTLRFKTGVMNNTISTLYGLDKMLNFHHSEVSNDDVMVASRLTVITEGTSSDFPITSPTMQVITPRILGSEFIRATRIYAITPRDGDLIARAIDTTTRSVYNESSQMVQALAVWSVFDWAPTMYMFREIGTNPTKVQFYQACDVDNYTLISEANLYGMHEAALASLFSSPTINIGLGERKGSSGRATDVRSKALNS